MVKNQVAIMIALTAVGFFCGWWTNTLLLPAHTRVEPVAGENQPACGLSPPDPVAPARVQQLSKNSQEKKGQHAASLEQQFRHLLGQQLFEEALALYDEAQLMSKPIAQLFRHLVHEQLQSLLEHNRHEALMNLIDLYLARHYDDIDVLMILAQYQQRQGYPDEAARVFQLALTYAHKPPEQQRIDQALQRLVANTDDTYVQQARWIELLSFYETLDTMSLLRAQNRLRLGQLYTITGHKQRARNILQPLLKDSQWQAKAQQVLNDIASGRHTDANSVVASLPLRRSGNHYLVNVRLNNHPGVVLMIDTGASVTSLSRQAFERLSRQSPFNKLHSRLFNTANGVTKGTVYQADQLILGDLVLERVEVAVMDFQPQDGVDGLLGMNVLKYFHFEIDQDQHQLKLQPR